MVSIRGLAPPRMIRIDSSRSSAVSTSVTSAGESSSPQGVRLPNACWYQRCEVDETGLQAQVLIVVVDPVAGERARSRHVARRCAVGVDGERKRRPRQRGGHLDKRRPVDLSRCRDPRATAGSLREANPPVAHFRSRAPIGKRNGSEGHAATAEPERRGTDVSAAILPVTGDATAVHLYPGGELVAEAETIRLAQGLERVDVVGGRVVVVSQAHLEGHLGHSPNRFRGNPRN